MPTKIKSQHHHIQLTTVSPVSIGGNQADKLSPYADYALSEDQQRVHYIDSQKFGERLMADEGHLLGLYTQAMTDTDNNRSDLVLTDFIEQHLKTNLDDVSMFDVPNHGMGKENRLEVMPIIRSAGKPFIPGSTLKGALRTALLHDWLEHTNEGQEALKFSYTLVEEAYELDREIAALFQKKKEKQKKGGRLNNQDFKTLRSKQYELRKKMNKVLDEQRLFGRLNDKQIGPDSQRMQVSDSSFFEKEDWGIFNAERVRLLPLKRQRGKGSSIPQAREAVLVGKTCTLKLDLRTEEREKREKQMNPYIKNLFSGGLEAMLNVVRVFSQAAMGIELFYLEDAYNMPNPQARDALINFYNQLYNRSEAGEVFIRIGMGKTYFDNSLGIAMFNYAEDHHSDGEAAFKKFRKLVHRVNERADIFPVTRTIATEGYRPFGWVKLNLM